MPDKIKIAKNVSFLTTSHLPYDDRIFYHFAVSLANQNYNVSVISSTLNIETIDSSISIKGFDGQLMERNKKCDKLFYLLKADKPDIIFCHEPLSVILASRYKRIYSSAHIIYDVTEWYPSKVNLDGTNHFSKLFKGLKMFIFNLYASSKADGFIFGEKAKKKPYFVFLPFKSNQIISYFPNLNYINYTKPNIDYKKFCICYTGKIDADKGVYNILKVLKALVVLNPSLELKFKVIGWFASANDKHRFYKEISGIHNIELELIDVVKYKEFSLKLQDVNLFIDLRQIDFEYNNSLPIKMFFYAACGRPVIYSDLKAIRKNVLINSFGFLAKPNTYENIAKIILNYINDKDLYLRHCYKARELAEEKYNWNNIEPLFLDFIKSF